MKKKEKATQPLLASFSGHSSLEPSDQVVMKPSSHLEGQEQMIWLSSS